jgi:hypothetical protein
MKKTIYIVAGIGMCFFTMTAFSQQSWDAKKNPTVDSIMSHYSAKYIAPKPALTTNDIFPVIGQYQSTANPEASSVTIALDEQNKGVIWITGLPQGRVKAMLRKSPAIYKIPQQKTEEGKEVAEGTLMFEKETNTLNIIIGKPYNTPDPASVFVTVPVEMQEATPKVSKSKTRKPVQPKSYTYSGTKLTVETVAN